ncbi:MAG: SOS response-associated peptidase [Gammaproteobacteria bacterium]
MCGRVNVTDYQAISILMESIGVPINLGAGIELSENLFPYYKPLVAGFMTEDNKIDSALMNWGWQRDWDPGKRLFNSRRVSAKGQVIWESPVWGEAIRRRRCLIPINAFYEWDQNQAKGKRNRYRVETSAAAFTLGGIFEISEDGEMFLSICTTDPNEAMAEIHHRMPVIIDSKDAEQWLASDNAQEIDELMQAKPEDYICMTKESQIGRTENLF